MDVNGTPYLLLREAAEFAHGSAAFGWDARRGAFTLRQAQRLRLPGLPAPAARAIWASAPALVQDPFGQIARIGAADGDIDRDHVVVNAGRGFAPLRDGELLPVAAPLAGDGPTVRLTDLALGGSPADARLVAAFSDGAARHGLLLFHPGRRWQTTLSLATPPVRAIVDPDGAVWCLTGLALLRCTGGPLPRVYQPQPLRFEPEVDNPRPFAPQWSQPLPAGHRPLALAADGEWIYLLCEDWPGWDGTGPDGAGQGRQRILTRARTALPDADWTDWPLDPDCPYAVDLGVFADGRLAAPAPREPTDADFVQRDCPVLELVGQGDSRLARLVLERYPRQGELSPRLVTGADGEIRYQAPADPASAHFTPRPRLLSALPRPEFPTAALVTLRLGPGGDGLDSGQPDTPWHRIYIDGCIPPGCRLTLFAKAYNDPASRAALPYAEQPPPLWNPLGSELPLHPPIAPPRRGESGLFEVLLQHRGGAVRTLTGRYLQLRIRMEGDGRHTPAIHALRIYAPRFSWQEAWLPPFFRQQAHRDDPDAPANGADVRERLLAACEGLLTPIEGRIAAAEGLLHPASAPAALLPTLAATLGIRVPAGWPEERQRRLLASGCLLQQWRGTWPGLRLALDIATDGGVARGEVVIVENFRLRRTFATILGLDLDDRGHPLTLGTGLSGNSIVGDSLILADGLKREFLALLAPELASEVSASGPTDAPLGSVPSDAAIVDAFFDRYSHRVSVLLHGTARARRGAVEALLATDLPAHLQVRIIETDEPFVLGLSPLLEIDSFLTTTPPPRRATLNETWLGREGVLTNPVALSPADV